VTTSAPQPSARNSALLHVDGLQSGYGKKEVLHIVSFAVAEKSIVAMIGPNGSGKSTVLKTVFGLMKAWRGGIEFDGQSCIGKRPPELIERGLVYSPQGNRVFGDLTVRQNLTVSLRGVDKAGRNERLDEMAALFPAVKEFMKNRAGNLSGGEKQQVALAMALMKRPRMLLLDEPSLGMAPNLLSDVFARLRQINQEKNVTMLIVEHKVREVFKIADWVLGLRRGEIVASGAPAIFDDANLKSLFLG